MKRGRYSFVVLLAAALVCGCTYVQMTYEKAKVHIFGHSPSPADIKRVLPEQCGFLMGRVSGKTTGEKPLVIVALSRQSRGSGVADSTVLSHPGSYMLFVPEGTYEILAFVDRNENSLCEASEFVGKHKSSEAISVVAGAVVGGVDIVVSGAGRQSFNFPIDVKIPDHPAGRHVGLEDGGTITLDDEIFSEKYGSMGLWSPDRFIAEAGIRIYARKEFDRTKTPILFVHGSGSTPKAWEPIFNEIDKELYQLWFFYYPSGLGLTTLSDLLYEQLQSLHDKYKFKGLCITAHSMGGMVVRSFINRYNRDKRHEYLTKFVSLSTPWGGTDSAKLTKHIVLKSVEYIPLCWTDLAPGSVFVKSLFQEKLPPQIKFYLLFGYKSESTVIKGANDGVVSLSYLLDLRAQSEATQSYGFNEDHTGILRAEEVFRMYNKILAHAAP